MQERPHHDHVLTAACGSWWSRPQDGTGVPVARGRILSSPLTRSAAAAAQVVVDVFDGGPNTRVSMTLDEGRSTPLELTRSAVPDPYIVDTFANPTFERPSWLRPGPSSRIRVGEIPDTSCRRIRVRDF